ncbi:MAG: M23 family metallopeptidase, partial [Ruminococcus sp.]|nr:M23 family metallopeptidase [Ruminococcus sp.]
PAETEQPEQSQAANIPAENVPKTTEETSAKEEMILEHDAFGGEEELQQAQQVRTEKTVTDSIIIPVNGEIICDYSDGELVKSKTLSVWKTHDGIDIGAEQGAIVKSMTSGTVTSVSSDPMMGVTVVIDHGSGYEGYYSNLSKDVNVTEGDTVSTGTAIGTVGATAESEISEDSHLHLGIKKNGSWTDPAALLSGEGS